MYLLCLAFSYTIYYSQRPFSSFRSEKAAPINVLHSQHAQKHCLSITIIITEIVIFNGIG